MAIPQHVSPSEPPWPATPLLDYPPPLDRLGADVAQASVKRQRSMKTREFALYAASGTESQSQSGSDMKPGPAAPSNIALYDRANHTTEQDGDDYYDAFDEMLPSATSTPMSPSVPGLPPLPISPISPRWDSLLRGSSALKSEPSLPFTDHTTSMENSQRPVTGAKSQASAFPALSSHPFSTDQNTPVPSSPSIRNFPLLESSTGAAQYRPVTPSSSTSKSYNRDDSPAGDGAIVVENFSRPRKASIRQGNNEPLVSRQRTGTLAESESGFSDQFPSNVSLNPSIQHNGWPRGRGFSTSSARSTNTYASLPLRPSNEHLNSSSRAASVRRATPSIMMKPPLTYSTGTATSTMRDPPRWVTTSSDELRSSFRSQLTTSTALGTVFTVSGTERSSVLTKTSSITESFIINGYARASVADEDGLSVEDVMGMYENGFHDDSEEEDGADADKEGSEQGDDDTRRFSPGTGPLVDDGSRPPTRGSGAGRIVDQMLEAMSDPLPIPGSSPIPSSEPIIARDSAAMFRNPFLPSSLPKDVGLGLASERYPVQPASREDTEAALAPRYGSATTLVANVAATMSDPVQDDSSLQSLQMESSVLAPNDTAHRSSSRAPTPPSTSLLPQEPEEDSLSRDRYGFRKANPYITREQYDAWNASYTDYLARRRKKWVAYLKDSSLMTENPNRFPPRNAKTKRFVRKGIPPDWRGAAWFYYAGGPGILAKHPGVYDELVRRAGLDRTGAGKTVDQRCDLKPLIVEDIEKDLHRTFPDNVRFKPPRTAKSEPHPNSPAGTEDSQMTLTNQADEAAGTEEPPEPEIISSLRRVLHAFALYNPRIGYCQSLNFLAGLLLLFVESEEHAFWLLNVITRVYLPGTHEMSLEGSKVDLGVLMAALKDTLPNVWKQIGGDEAEMATPGQKKPKTRRFRDVGAKNAPMDLNRLPAITLCMTAWFMSCFIGTLPMETVLRVWDIFFYEGSRTLFRVALTIFKLGEAEIKAVGDPMEMFGVVQSLPRRMLDCNALLEACYKKRNNFKHLNQEVVDDKRQEQRDAIRRWKAVQDAAQTAGQTPAKIGVVERAAAGLDLAADMNDPDGIEVRRKGTLFGRRKDKEKEKIRAEDVL